MALQTSPEQPAPVRVVSEGIASWIGRMGSVWVEGQVAQVSVRDRTSYLTLRDTEVEMSLRVVLPTSLLTSSPVPVEAGARVIVEAKPDFYPANGSLSLRAREIRAVGLGELLARIEHLKNVLAAEGLFAPERKQPLPFLPRRVGLICGRNSDAMHDVIENARRRWPATTFEVREVAVQGPLAVTQVVEALRELDDMDTIDVIVITRGGGSVEDLLPFSDEGMVRAVAAAQTPVVCAIGHEKDTPILDLVADVRASTPTDAARRIVPDLNEQIAGVAELRSRSRRALEARVTREFEWLDGIRRRPVMASPWEVLARHSHDVRQDRERARRALQILIERSSDDVAHVLARVRALSPQATLERGYAIVATLDGRVIRDPHEAAAEDRLRVRVARGDFDVTPA